MPTMDMFTPNTAAAALAHPSGVLIYNSTSKNSWKFYWVDDSTLVEGAKDYIKKSTTFDNTTFAPFSTHEAW